MPDPAPLPPPLDARRPSPPVSWRDRLERLANALGVAPARLVLGGAVAVGAIGVAIALFAAHAHLSLHGPVEASLPRARVGATATPTSDASSTSTEPAVVAAAGAVLHPGVYKLPAGSRVIDVIAAAGGAATDADLDRVNLAAKVTDGQRVYVPRKGEAGDPGAVAGDASAGGGDSAAAIVDLNSATEEQLESLPGVGPATAKAILDYRTQHGRFRSVNELLNVRGIGESKLAQLRPHVRV
jgi:competence protein ComEA